MPKPFKTMQAMATIAGRSSTTRFRLIPRASRIVCQSPTLLHRLNRVKTLIQGPNSSGKSRHGAPVRCFQRMASIMFRWFLEGRPVLPRSGGSNGANLSHM